MAARHTQSRRRSSAPGKPAPRQRGQSNLAGPEHAARASAQVDAAVSAVDAWYESGEPSGEIDLTDSCMAAVEAAEARASELGATSTRSTHGGRVVVKLALGSGG